jgi:hypothetical protein
MDMDAVAMVEIQNTAALVAILAASPALGNSRQIGD